MKMNLKKREIYNLSESEPKGNNIKIKIKFLSGSQKKFFLQNKYFNLMKILWQHLIYCVSLLII